MTYPILDTDIFASGADALVCPSNTRGTPGKALAAAFARNHPEAVAIYKKVCAAPHGRPLPGSVITAMPGMPGMPAKSPRIYFAMTKDHWSNPSKLEWIRDIAAKLLHKGLAGVGYVQSIAVPALGCGEGKLPWDDVRPILVEMAEELAKAGVKVLLYGPDAGKKPRGRR